MPDLSQIPTDQLLQMLQQHAQPQDTLSQSAANAAAEMSTGERFLAGMGRGVARIGLGARQLVGKSTPEELDEFSKLSRGLSSDAEVLPPIEGGRLGVHRVQRPPRTSMGAADVGDIAGNALMAITPGLAAAGAGKALAIPELANAGRYMLASPATPAGAITQGTMGAIQAGLQPVMPGQSRLLNAGAGFAGGAAIPTIGMGLKAANALTEPLYGAGQQRIIGRALRSASGDNPQVISNLQNARQLVPGSVPTAAEVADSGGIAAMQRAAAAVDPESYAARAAQQNEARVSALQDLAGTSGARKSAEVSREATTGPMYRSAFDTGIAPQVAAANRPLIQNLMERMPSGVVDKAKEIARIEGRTLTDANSLEGLHYTKKAIDDLIERAPDTGVGSQMKRALSIYKQDLLNTMDQLSPQYGNARQTFQTMSRPINQMDIAQELADKSVNPLTGQLQPLAFARNLSDETAQRATGFNGATLKNTLDPQQLERLNAIKQDLARNVAARDLGRGPGSDTVQKLAMTNLAQQTGIPMGVLNAPGLGRFGNWLYSETDAQMKNALARALLNPKDTGDLMANSIPSERAKRLAMVMRASTPLMSGSVPVLLDSSQ